MNLLVSLAFRNITRNVKRTVITSVSVVAGVGILILGSGFVEGMEENIVRTHVDNMSGHVMLNPPGYPVEGMLSPVDALQPLPDDLRQRLADYTWTPRLQFDAWLSTGADNFRVRGLGYQPDTDPAVFPRDRVRVEGRWPEQAQGAGLAVGVRVAALMGVAVGDEVVLQARTSAGALNALSFPVDAIITTQNPAIDGFIVMMPAAAAEALVRAPGPSHVALRLRDPADAEAVAASLDGDWSALPYRELAKDQLALMAIRRNAVRLFVLMLMLIAATGIANTVIMAAYERVREVGTLAAMGMTPGQVRAMFLLEGMAMGLSAAVLGGLLGGLANHRLSVVGIDLSAVLDNVGVAVPMETMLYTRFAWSDVAIAMAFGVLVAAAASLYPANMAARLNPADAVRAD